ncbi:MAG: ATP phosphoribosyltransferase [Catenibacterium sp.]|uniref:ATP phosphoribosyltransferase n=1 Tax=Catenibacterium sp. TaxID=2049022 RepID=UPI003994CE94
MIVVGLPKGVLKEKSKLLAETICNCKMLSSQLKLKNNKYTFLFLKHRDIPRFIDLGILDYGITSDEWIKECDKKNIQELMTLNWCSTKMALIGSKDTENIRTCSTEFQNIARKYFNDKNVNILYISGSSETLIQDVTDASIDCVETGKTLKDNNLIIKDILFQSEVKLIGNANSNKYEIKEIIDYLKGYEKR